MNDDSLNDRLNMTDMVANEETETPPKQKIKVARGALDEAAGEDKLEARANNIVAEMADGWELADVEVEFSGGRPLMVLVFSRLSEI